MVGSSPTTPYRLVVFDLDGTLIDSAEDLAGSVNAALSAHELSGLSVERVVGFIGEGVRRLIQRSVEAARPGASRDTVEGVLKVFEHHYREHCLDRTCLYGGMEDALHQLASRGKSLAVLTNKPRQLADTILTRLGVGDLFAGVIGGDDLATRKPDPQGLWRLVHEAGCARHETLLVGDSAIDVATAARAGTGSCGVTWGFASERDLLLSGATHIVRVPAAIPSICG